MKNTKKYLALFFILYSLFLLPSISYAQVAQDAGANQGQFIPCDGVDVKCDFPMLMKLVSKLLNYLVLLAFPLAILTFAYAGFTYMTTGVSDKKSQAKSMLLKVVIGFVVLLAAWVIVRTILTVFLKQNIIDAVPLNLN